MRDFYIYIMSNVYNRVLYIGVTNDLQRRVAEHRSRSVKGFTQKYNVTKLVNFEHGMDIEGAITREKQLKGWLRAKKNALIETVNPMWQDLAP
jgi:putative endonuclease